MPVTITHTTRKNPPSIPAEDITRTIIHPTYQLSLVYIGSLRAKRLNQIHRHKDYVPNILSFPLTDQAGEIYICPVVAKKEAPKFGLNYKQYLTFLLIHGLLHLKGYDHGATMERLEQKYLQQFNVST